jgi:NAD(P)-dependent dehydrogenase (short-subunit alcohol dehydrogenase family)
VPAVLDVERELGAPDVLVNNAGMTSAAAPALEAESGTVLDLAPHVWRSSVARNLDTAYLVYLVTRAVLPHMVRAR